MINNLKQDFSMEKTAEQIANETGRSDGGLF